DLEVGNFNHSLAFNFRSGYTDQEQVVNLIDEDGNVDYGTNTPVQLDVPSYTTTEYQLNYRMLDDALSLTLGVNNLFDEEPPLSLRVSGSGHQVGWDPRYSDAYGRTVYFAAKYTF